MRGDPPGLQFSDAGSDPSRVLTKLLDLLLIMIG